MLSDFGFSRIRHERTRTGTRSSGIGTHLYNAPEIFSGDIIRGTVTADTYACSLAILELATGELPFVHVSNVYALPSLVLMGERPLEPLNIGPFPSDSVAGQSIWKLLVQMWDQQPTN